MYVPIFIFFWGKMAVGLLECHGFDDRPSGTCRAGILRFEEFCRRNWWPDIGSMVELAELVRPQHAYPHWASAKNLCYEVGLLRRVVLRGSRYRISTNGQHEVQLTMWFARSVRRRTASFSNASSIPVGRRALIALWLLCWIGTVLFLWIAWREIPLGLRWSLVALEALFCPDVDMFRLAIKGRI